MVNQNLVKALFFNHYVFCSDMTFDATVNPVVYEGGIPVFIDTEYDTWNMDTVALEKHLKYIQKQNYSNRASLWYTWKGR